MIKETGLEQPQRLLSSTFPFSLSCRQQALEIHRRGKGMITTIIGILNFRNSVISMPEMEEIRIMPGLVGKA